MENRGNIITAVFTDSRSVYTDELYRKNYGQLLKIQGLPLPLNFETHFSMNGDIAKPMIGTTEDGVGTVEIPDEYLEDSGILTAYIYLHAGLDDGETEYVIRTKVIPRPDVDPSEPTPVQQDVITQAIAALDNAVEITEENAEKSDKSAEDSEAWAVGERKGVPVEEDDETYQNNSKYYADMAEQVASEAGFINLYIDDAGHLIYEKTDTVDLEFFIENGNLMVEV